MENCYKYAWLNTGDTKIRSFSNAPSHVTTFEIRLIRMITLHPYDKGKRKFPVVSTLATT